MSLKCTREGLPSNGSKKLYGDLIIDDRALGCPVEWEGILDFLKGKLEGSE